MSRIAIVSDTHGLLRPEVVERLEGVERILHIGDVCGGWILDELGAIAPVTAVRGNCDPAGAYPETAVVEWAGTSFYLIHILEELDLDPGHAGVDFVLFGHTHRPETFVRRGVRYLNPGSIGPRRFKLPISFAIVDAAGDVEFVTVAGKTPPSGRAGPNV